MPANYSVFTRILGEDLASEVFRKVGASAKSAFAPIKAFNQAVNEPGTTALGHVGSKVDQVAGKFRSGLGSITAWLPALGAIGSAATLGGLVAMTRHNAEAFEGLVLSAEKLGVSTKDLAVWRFGARMTGVEAEAMEKGLVKLKKAMYDAATGRNKDVALLFQRMKIPLRDAAGAVRNVDASLDDIAEAFRNTTDEEVKSRAALALFGKSGADMLPFLNRGRAGIAAWREELKKYSNLSDENRRDLGELAEGYKRLDKAGAGLSMKLSAVFAPAMARVVNGTTNWIVANRDLIAQSLERKLDGIGRALDHVARVGAGVLAVPFVAELFRGADASTAFDAGLGLLGITMAGPVFAAIQTVTLAWGRMTVAMLGNPVGAAVALLAVQVWSLRQHWEEDVAAIRAANERGFGAGALEIFRRWNGASLIARSFNDLVKELAGVDLIAIHKQILGNLLKEIQSWIPSFEEVWKKILPSFAVKAAGYQAAYAGPGAAAPTSPADIAAAYQQAYQAKPLLSDPLAAAVNQVAAPPQRVDVVFSGEIKAPPGSSIDTRVEDGTARGRPDVGYSMRAETAY